MSLEMLVRPFSLRFLPPCMPCFGCLGIDCSCFRRPRWWASRSTCVQCVCRSGADACTRTWPLICRVIGSFWPLERGGGKDHGKASGLKTAGDVGREKGARGRPVRADGAKRSWKGSGGQANEGRDGGS